MQAVQAVRAGQATGTRSRRLPSHTLVHNSSSTTNTAALSSPAIPARHTTAYRGTLTKHDFDRLKGRRLTHQHSVQVGLGVLEPTNVMQHARTQEQPRHAGRLGAQHSCDVSQGFPSFAQIEEQRPALQKHVCAVCAHLVTRSFGGEQNADGHAHNVN